MSAVALEAIGIARTIGRVPVVEHMSLLVERERIVAIIGPNGAGKTTFFDCLSGVDKPDAGTVLLDGVDVTSAPSDRRARMGLARTFQHSSVFSTLTVGENLRVAAEHARRRWIVRGLAGLPDPDTERVDEAVDEALGRLGLRDLRDVRAGLLPTGTLRAVELARALCTNPTVLLLDEPAGGLTHAEIDELHLLLHSLADGGLAIAMIEHDLELVANVADTIVVMADGREVATGTPAAIMERPDVRDLVLGAGGR